MSVLIFALKTVPDLDAGRRLHQLDGLDDRAVENILLHKQRQANGTEVLGLHMQRIASLSLLLRQGEEVEMHSFVSKTSDDGDIVREFFARIERYKPALVSWNGLGFGLPVMNYRALRHSVCATHYWTGDYHHANSAAHTDLLEVLAIQQRDAHAPLTEIASLLGQPTIPSAEEATDMPGQSDRDVLAIYLIYLRLGMMRGQLTSERYTAACASLRDTLRDSNSAQLNDFLAHWTV